MRRGWQTQMHAVRCHVERRARSAAVAATGPMTRTESSGNKISCRETRESSGQAGFSARSRYPLQFHRREEALWAGGGLVGGRRPHLVCAMERDAPGRPLQKLGANKPKRDYAGIEERRAEHKEPVAGTESAATQTEEGAPGIHPCRRFGERRNRFRLLLLLILRACGSMWGTHQLQRTESRCHHCYAEGRRQDCRVLQTDGRVEHRRDEESSCRPGPLGRVDERRDRGEFGRQHQRRDERAPHCVEALVCHPH